MKCILCDGSGHSPNTYAKNQPCPRCGATGQEPADPPLHPGMIVRNRRSGKVWAIYAVYDDGQWGIHRFKPSRRGGYYVWQIRMTPASHLADKKRWEPIGVGDAWDHELMESEDV